MNSREKVLNIFKRKANGERAFWTGHLNDATVPIYASKWGLEPEREAIYSFLEDDCRWVIANAGYKHPEGKPIFDCSYGINRGSSLSAAGCFADAETIADIERYPWPDTKYLDFSDIYSQIEQYPDKMVFTGLWSSFFHDLADFFGMENLFVQMYENPEVVEAATEHIVDFYVAGNEIFFAGLGDRADTMFFGNDFGTQRDLIFSPEAFKRFILPSIKRLVAVGKRHNKIVMMHSCGSIHRVIPDLIDAGVDVLHPIQAQAHNMDAQTLMAFKNDLAFLGGIDAQSFIVEATPQQVGDEVARVREVLGPNIVISPSHEEILPNIPPENILALAKAAH